MHRIKTVALLATLTALILWAGQAFGGSAGLGFALLLAAGMNLGSWWFADRIVLRMYHAKEVTAAAAPDLHAMVRDLALRAQLPMPRIYIVPDDNPNAFATGRNAEHGVVAVTEGLLRGLDRREVAAVIAHELGHIRNRDTLVMSIAATLGGAVSMLANMAMWSSLLGGGSRDDEDGHPAAGLLGIILAPLVATMVQMGISRSREFLADAAAARFTGDPLALAGALRKIEHWSRQIPMQAGAPATAHLLIYNPFSGAGLTRWFSTHPPTDDRIARLEAMAAGRLPYAA
jgi:heat shock protein HtpX